MSRKVYWSFGLVVMIWLCAPLSAVAQQSSDQQPADQSPKDANEYVEPTDQQIRLNDEAVRSLAAGDAVKAVSLLEEANYLGELNVTFLNLGRAYQQMGKCAKARQAFEAVKTSPKVRQPPPGFINKKADTFLAELEEQCEQGAQDAPSGDKTNDTTTIDPDGGEFREPSASTSPWGVTAIVGAAALLGTGVGLHFLAESYRNEVRDAQANDDGQIVSLTQAEARSKAQSANTLDTVGLSSAIVGAAAVGVGTYLLLSTPEVDVAVRFDGGGASAFCRMRF